MCFFLSDIKGAWHSIFKTVFCSRCILYSAQTLQLSVKCIPVMQLSFYSKIVTLTSIPSLFGSLGPITSFPYSISVFSVPRQKVRTPAKRVSQPRTSKHPPGPSRSSRSTHAATRCRWISFAGTWGKRLLQSCAETRDPAAVYVPRGVRNATGLCIRLGAFISYGTFLLPDIQGGTRVSKVKFLQLGWSSDSPCMSRKEMGISRVCMVSWLTYLAFSMAYKCSLHS